MASMEPIAIIGSGCRFPGASSTPSKLWQLLSQPRDVAREIPADRFNLDSFYHADAGHHGTGNVKVSYFLDEDVTKFDASFFNVKPMEAKTMDPQHRLLLETVYEAIEAAGLDMATLRGTNTAVYCGVMCGDYENLLLRDVDNLARYHATGIGRSLMSNRISYFFDWRGPSITLDTACSSSLIAVHEAVQVLRSGRSKVAVAAGSNLLLGPENYIAESNLNMLSPDGRSRMWDAAANGYARGEGVAAVVLKTLSQALADGDPIECIVRNTGINQDGRTSGITMPSPTSQTELIQSTYREIGLDPRTSRPQYFEAHGTGTPAGDPVEAKAIHDAFFGAESTEEDGKLLVGSIKTVVGHTEGTAGLAALLKASLCLQAGKVAPNLLFENLSDSVRPYYDRLEIPTTLTEWPAPPRGEPRRASVNSFGFGGANAHAILEAYEPNVNAPAVITENSKTVGSAQTPAQPMLLSAASRSSLRSLVSSYIEYLTDNPHIDLSSLASTLAARRATHAFRVSYAAGSAEELARGMRKSLGSAEKFGVEARSRDGAAAEGRSLRILGIFTGQGAQWAGMGRELLAESPYCSDVIDSLDKRLAQLPKADRPDWTLREELMADETTSRVSQAALSQPLCAAVQIMLVGVLRAAGIAFSAVVGHSSGEIGAAFAAGAISAEDAIVVAYYRGLHSRLTRGRKGEQGAMLAVSKSLQEAQALVAGYGGRIAVAASNSPSSATLSGDEDAVKALKSQLDGEGAFARLLKVDKAYHSHHMEPCAEPYGKALAENTSVDIGSATCPWYSSVHNGELGHEALAKRAPGQYWVENMAQPVLFSQALQAAIDRSGPFDLTIEVGPHPALRGPALQTVGKDATVYIGTLGRGTDAFSALASNLGTAWTHLGRAVDMERYVQFVSGGSERHEVLRGLPTYAWDHETSYWHESRRSRVMRTSGGRHHELLGRLCPEVTSRQLAWRNYLDTREMPWLDGHQLQGQSVFPAAGYVVMAIEAALFVAGRRGRRVRVVEVKDVAIRQAVSLGDDGVETLLSLTDLDLDDTSLTAAFSLFASSGTQSDSMALVADGRVRAILEEKQDADGESETRKEQLLRPAVETDGKLLSRLEASEFYEYLDSLGYGYSGTFRALSNIERCLDSARSTLTVERSGDENADEDEYILHPAVLDCAFQTAILAFSAPYDGRLWSLHVPTTIRKVVVDVEAARAASRLEVAAELDEQDDAPICGDLDLCSSGTTVVQVEQIRCVPFARATEADDTLLFSETAWDVDRPDVSRVAYDGQPTQYEHDLAVVAERACYYYLRLLDSEIPKDHPARSSGPYEGMFEYARHILDRVAADDHLHVTKKWDTDKWEDIERICEPYKHTVDIRMVHAAGQNFRDVVLGKTTMLEHMRKDGLLDRYYEQALAFPQYSRYIGRAVAQLSHRFPRMNILEVGAGTGGATKSILRELHGAYNSYTFTDISSGFFPTATEVFADEGDKMIFKTLDIGRSGREQGFQEQAYDLIVASFVLHATDTLEQTMRNARRLLKPGGYIMMLEVTNNEPIREGSVFGCLPGWWLGRDDGRVYSPCIGVVEWDGMLRRTGFGGVDAVTPELDALAHPVSLIVSQAVDDRVLCLREPLVAHSARSALRDPLLGSDLLIIGGDKALPVVRLARTVADVLRSRVRRVTISKTIESIPKDGLGPQTVVVCLADLDKPVFGDLTESRWNALRRVFDECKRVLWVTQGRLADNPHANISIGFGRTQLLEAIGLTCQFVDVDTIESSTKTANLLAEMLVRLAYSAQWTADGVADDSNLLWTLEQEVVVKDNTILLPRLKRSASLNNRYNASRRVINREVPASSVVLRPRRGISALASTQTGFLEASEALPSDPTDVDSGNDTVTVCVNAFIATPLVLGPGLAPLFLVSGSLQSEQASDVVALSPSQASVLRLPRSLVIRSGVAPSSDTLKAVGRSLIAASVLGSLHSGQSLLVCGADLEQAEVLSFYAKQTSCAVTFVAREGAAQATTKKTATSRIEIPFRATTRALRRMLPMHVDFLVDLSSDPQPDVLFDQLASLFKEHAISLPSPLRFAIHGSGGVSSLLSNSTAPEERHDLATLLQKSLLYASSSAFRALRPSEERAITLRELVQAGADSSLARSLTVVDSSPAQDLVPIPVLPAPSQVKFRSDRTYWLQGLSGSLGLSLCQWMLFKGAKHVVLSSRNPKIDPKWLARMKSRGANVVVVACDITSRADVQRVHDRIVAEMPPIAGVTQGAMVLDDGVIQNLTHTNVVTALRPKVDGSIHLDEVLSDHPLDFFVYFSSGAFVTGRMGQANYTAANAYMVSAAARRRTRGLAGSVLHLGPVVGVGYVERIDRVAVREGLIKTGYNFMSESDFHAAFAEAVLASPSDAGHDMEVVTCVRSFSRTDAEKPVWSENPRMSHLCVRKAAASSVNDGRSEVSVKSQLLDCVSRADVHRVIQDALVQKLKGSLQLDIEGDSVATRGLDSAGVDSLIAVEIRAWFSQTIGVNVPVLKILSGITVVELVKHAATELSPGLTPKVTPDGPDVVDGADTPDLAQSDAVTTAAVSSSDDGSSDATSTSPSSESPVATTPGAAALSRSVSPGSEQLGKPVEKVQSSQEPSRSMNVIRSEPLCYGQAMFWFTKTFLDDPTTLNHAALCRITGPLRVDDLSRAVHAVAGRHESLRTCFFQDEDGEPRQGIMAESVMELDVEAIRAESDAWAALDAMMAHVYDLERGQLMCAKLLTLADDPTINFLLIGSHHINFDGFSAAVLVRHYQLAYAGKPLPWDILQYPAYGRQQARDIATGRSDQKLAFWKTKFERLPPVLPLLPMARVVARKALDEYDHHRFDVRIDAETCALVRAACRELRCTPFHFHLATFRLLLTRLSSAAASASDDGESRGGALCVGIAEANRNSPETADCLGPLMGLLPLFFKHVDGPRTTSFGDLVRDTKDVAYEALANGGVPFDLLLRELSVPRSRDYSPLFQAFVDYRMGTQEKMAFGDCDLEMLRLESGRAAYDVSLDIIDNAGGSGSGDCLVSVMAQKSLYDAAATQLLGSCYEHLVQALAASPSAPLTAVQHYPPAIVAEALSFGQGELRGSTWQSSLPEQIMRTTEKCPNKVAIKDGYGSVLSYRGLRERILAISELLAPSLQSPSSSPVVAVYQEPSADWVCSMIAIMRIGAVYVPLDMATPIPRLRKILEDCRPNVIVVQSQTVETARSKLLSASPGAEILVLQPRSRASDSAGISAVASPDVDGASPCAILYTSGSTGVPKGIVLTHNNLANEVEQSAHTYGFGSDDVVLQQSALSFDMSLTQIFSAVAHGGTLCMVPLALRGDALGIVATMAREGVTFTGATPSEYAAWLAHGGDDLTRCHGWRIALAGGEPIKPSLLDRFRALAKTDLSLFNAYGPTETTCSATRGKVDYHDLDTQFCADKTVSAGRPAPNSFVYLVQSGTGTEAGAGLQPVPVGVPGEIVVAGAGVARGYFNRSDLTSTAFVPGSYFSDVCADRGWSVLHYRTGDRGRWRADGTLLIEGRVVSQDTQVKLGGMRIDLCEIEAIIAEAAMDRIAEVVVTVHRNPAAASASHIGENAGADTDAGKDEDEQEGFLVAYVVPMPEAKLDLEHFRAEEVALRLPLRMLPAVIVPIERLPTTVSGKVDRRAVAALPLPRLATDYNDDPTARGFARTGPTVSDGMALSTAEAGMLDLWATVTNSTLLRSGGLRVTARTDFFHVGGNSLLLIKLQASIARDHGVRVPLVQLFEHSSLGGMASLVNSRDTKNSSSAIIDWESETEVPVEWARETTSLTGRVSITAALRLVMTGASGFLGVKLLERLVASPRVAHVYCIAVRNPAKLAAATTAAHGPKVSVFPGDLTSERLGLSSEDAAVIFAEADAVLHNGCDVSHMRSYESLKPVNYGATREIVRLALPHRVPVHFVSSAEVSIYSGAGEFRPTSAAPFPPPSSTAEDGGVASVDGYTACKWASEIFLEKTCHLAPDLPVAIYRPTSIVRGAAATDIGAVLSAADVDAGADASGGDRPARDLWQELFFFSSRIGAVPTSAVVRGVINFVGFETVVDRILDGVLSLRRGFGLGLTAGASDVKLGQPHYLNLSGTVEMPLDEWQLRLSEWTGSEVTTIPLREWAARAGEAGLNPVLAQFFAQIESMGGLVFPRVLSSL